MTQDKPFNNPPDSEIRGMLEETRSIAVIGLSDKPDRDSHSVSQSLQEWGYRIIPVNPNIDEVLGEKSCKSLDDLPEKPDLVDVFRQAEHVAGIVDDCIRLEIPALWLQLRVVDDQAAARAVAAGITTVMDLCIFQEYRRLMPQNGRNVSS